MKRAWVIDLVRRLPQGVISRALGWVARRRRPRLGVAILKRAFVSASGADMSEARNPIGTYQTLEELFVRRLRPGARRVDPQPDSVVSPVDGEVGACGIVEDESLMQVKGRSYRLTRLLGGASGATRFEGGPYATLYLAPRNYHRIHAPVAGKVAEATVIPGALMPVFPEALEQVDDLFCRNERVVTFIDTPDGGRLAIVKVGAMMVGRIRVAYDPEIQTNCNSGSERSIEYDPPKLVNKGAELGAFELGSTVVLVGEPLRLDFSAISTGDRVRMGERIGAISGRKRKRRRAARARPASPKAIS